jgi:ADP-ribose pyrophosphatase
MDGAENMTEECVESRRVYDGRIVNLRVDSVRLPDGRIARREVVEHRPAVVILAENDARQILLVRQFRYPAGEVLIELPAGVVEDGEDFTSAAVRELQEETGWKPENITKVAEFYTSPGFCGEFLALFHAAGLVEERLPADEDECIVSRFTSADEVERLLEAGSVRDCKTLFGLFWWLRRERERRS